MFYNFLSWQRKSKNLFSRLSEEFDLMVPWQYHSTCKKSWTTPNKVTTWTGTIIYLGWICLLFKTGDQFLVKFSQLLQHTRDFLTAFSGEEFKQLQQTCFFLMVYYTKQIYPRTFNFFSGRYFFLSYSPLIIPPQGLFSSWFMLQSLQLLCHRLSLFLKGCSVGL